MNDTIVAMSSPPGGSARAVVRLSGPRARDLAAGVFHPLPRPWRWREGELLLPGWPPAPASALAFRAPLTTFFLVGVPAALELLPLWLSGKTATIAQRLAPEFILLVMAVWIAVILVAGFATTGATTRFFLHATQDAAGVSQTGGER